MSTIGLDPEGWWAVSHAEIFGSVQGDARFILVIAALAVTVQNH